MTIPLAGQKMAEICTLDKLIALGLDRNWIKYILTINGGI